jgi:hypothetical protein
MAATGCLTEVAGPMPRVVSSIDVAGRQRHGVHAPFAGRVGAHRTFASVRPGDIMFTVFRPLEAAS